jgi:uncharacterized membrane protein YfhO
LLGDTWFPGWRAEIDGKRVEILEAFGSIRAIVLEAGTHDVRFRYLPWSVLLGGTVTLMGLAVMGIAAKGC